MEKLNYLLAVIVISLAVIGSTMGQRIESCDVQRSIINNNKVDVHCDCMQRLNQMSLAISRLTINQTGCSDTGLELGWPALETQVAPEVLILVGAQIFFSPHSSEEWNSSIKYLEFIDSEFKEIPADVFKGLDLLEEVRLIGSAVETIQSDAFRGLDRLKLVEIANSTITIIEDHAFNNLPVLEDLAIVYSSIGSIESGAISLIPTETTVRKQCADIARSISEPTEMFEGIMGRELTTIGNLSLPEYGSRLLLYKNNIMSINSKAINSNTLGFLIVGGNHIMNVEQEAFNMELYNECEISAALFVGNTIDTLSSLAFMGLRGKDGVSYQTFIALANNKFFTVFEKGFRLSENIVIFAVEENRFSCDCDNFGWILSNPNSQIQRELEKELVLKAKCLDGTNLISFTSSCTDHGKTTEGGTVPTTESAVVTDSVVTTMPPRTSGRPPVATTDELEGSSASVITLTTSIFTFVACHLLL